MVIRMVEIFIKMRQRILNFIVVDVSYRFLGDVNIIIHLLNASNTCLGGSFSGNS